MFTGHPIPNLARKRSPARCRQSPGAGAVLAQGPTTAVREAVWNEAEGYPYFLQQWGVLHADRASLRLLQNVLESVRRVGDVLEQGMVHPGDVEPCLGDCLAVDRLVVSDLVAQRVEPIEEAVDGRSVVWPLGWIRVSRIARSWAGLRPAEEKCIGKP